MSPKTQKILIIGSITGVIALVAGFFIVRRKKATDLEKAILASVDITGDKTVSPLILWPLKYGSGYLSDQERSCVRLVQMYLNKKIDENNVYALPILVVDGHFGTGTENTLYKIAGARQVSYTLYNTMQGYVNDSSKGGFIDSLFSIKP